MGWNLYSRIECGVSAGWEVGDEEVVFIFDGEKAVWIGVDFQVWLDKE